MTIVRKEQGVAIKPVVLDVAVLRPFEIGARLDALLCYPTWPFERQMRIAAAICASVIAHSIAVDPSRKADLLDAFPEYATGHSRTSLETLLKRRDDALNAGFAFLPLLKNAAIGELPILRNRRQELSIDEIARFVWPGEVRGPKFDYGDHLHDRKRHGMRRYYPVAHLAAAYQYVARKRWANELAAAFDYQDLDFHREVVRRANEYAGYFAAMPKWANIANFLVPILWRE